MRCSTSVALAKQNCVTGVEGACPPTNHAPQANPVENPQNGLIKIYWDLQSTPALVAARLLLDAPVKSSAIGCVSAYGGRGGLPPGNRAPQANPVENPRPGLIKNQGSSVASAGIC